MLLSWLCFMLKVPLFILLCSTHKANGACLNPMSDYPLFEICVYCNIRRATGILTGRGSLVTKSLAVKSYVMQKLWKDHVNVIKHVGIFGRLWNNVWYGNITHCGIVSAKTINTAALNQPMMFVLKVYKKKISSCIHTNMKQ